MHKPKRLGRTLLLLLAIGALGAVSASSAMAAQWSNQYAGMKLSGSVTVSTAGEPTKTCTAPTTQVSIVKLEEAWIASSGKSTLVYSCSGGGTLSVLTFLKALTTTSASMGVGTGSGSLTETSPWAGTYSQSGNPVGDWVNGVWPGQSTLTFGGEDSIGTYAGSPVRISGTLTVTNGGGGLITII